jgi:hypothetical protein
MALGGLGAQGGLDAAVAMLAPDPYSASRLWLNICSRFNDRGLAGRGLGIGDYTGDPHLLTARWSRSCC